MEPSSFNPTRALSAAERIELVIDTAERAAAEIRADAEAQAQRQLGEARRQAEALTRERVTMISELTEAMLEHATLVATQCEGLIRALESTMRRLGPEPASPEPASPEPPPIESRRAQPAPPTPPQQPPAPVSAPPRPGPAWPPSVAEPDLQARAFPEPERPPAPQPPPALEPAPQPGPDPLPPAEPDPVPPSGPAAEAPWVSPPSPAGEAIPDEAYLRATRLALGDYDREEISRKLSAEFGIEDPEPILDRVLGNA